MPVDKRFQELLKRLARKNPDAADLKKLRNVIKSMAESLWKTSPDLSLFEMEDVIQESLIKVLPPIRAGKVRFKSYIKKAVKTVLIDKKNAELKQRGYRERNGIRDRAEAVEKRARALEHPACDPSGDEVPVDPVIDDLDVWVEEMEERLDRLDGADRRELECHKLESRVTDLERRLNNLDGLGDSGRLAHVASFSEFTIEDANGNTFDLVHQAPSPLPGPDEQLDFHQRNELLRRAIGTLSISDQRIVELKLKVFAGEITHGDIPEILGMPRSTVDHRFNTEIRKRLRKKLKELDPSPPSPTVRLVAPLPTAEA